MKILFVTACCRGEQSRTLRLGKAALQEVLKREPGAEVTEQDLYVMQLRPMDAGTLAVRESLCDACDWTHELTRHAVAFRDADLVIIAAPYWDLSFPAVLKTWVENMWVRNLTFHYENDRPVGHCRGKACIYVTTAGSYICKTDFGTDYIRGVVKTLGIPGFVRISAEGLDLDGNDVEQIMAQALRRMKTAVGRAQKLLENT